MYDDGWRLHVQGHGLKDADLPASLRNQIQNEANTNPTGKPMQFVGPLLQ